LLVVAAILISAIVVRSSSRAAARRKREAHYSDSLKAYSDALHPGMMRRDVEEYLRSRNAQFSWIYTAYGGRRESQYADVVKIGEESAPWYCSEAYVYIAFEFLPVNSFSHDQTPTDVLQRIEIFRPYTGCL